MSKTLSNIPKSYHLIRLLHLECSNIQLLVVATVSKAIFGTVPE
jgi:Leucine-rich repeat (LRR) protein